MKSVERLFVFCEGQTEETFTNIVLAPHFDAMFRATAYPLLLPTRKGAHDRRMGDGGRTDADDIDGTQEITITESPGTS